MQPTWDGHVRLVCRVCVCVCVCTRVRALHVCALMDTQHYGIKEMLITARVRHVTSLATTTYREPQADRPRTATRAHFRRG